MIAGVQEHIALDHDLPELHSQRAFAAYANADLSYIDVDLGLESGLQFMTEFPPLLNAEETFSFASEMLNKPLVQIAAQQIQIQTNSRIYGAYHGSAVIHSSGPTNSLVTESSGITQSIASSTTLARPEPDTRHEQAIAIELEACMTTMSMATMKNFLWNSFDSPTVTHNSPAFDGVLTVAENQM